MDAKKFIGTAMVLLLILCLSPFLGIGRAQSPTPFAPGPPVIYLPFIFSIKKAPAPPPPSGTQVNPGPTATSNPAGTATTNPTTTVPPGNSTPTPTRTAIPSTGDAVIADHTVISQFAGIPQSAIQQAAAIQTLFMHQSTGNNIRTMGLDCLQGTEENPDDPESAECATYTDYYYDRRNWDWPQWRDWPPLSDMADAIAKTDAWFGVANDAQANYQVLGMKYCYVDGYNLDFEYYRQKMEALEQAYPDKTFIWSTSALWGVDAMNGPNVSQVSKDSIQAFNDQVRAYASANDKYLYDIADIESHDLNGNLCLSNDGYAGLCLEYNDGRGAGGGGHPDPTGSLRLAKGFWWLMARISGWNGS